MIVSIFVSAWMYDKSIQEPIIEKDVLDLKIIDLKDKIIKMKILIDGNK